MSDVANLWLGKFTGNGAAFEYAPVSVSYAMTVTAGQAVALVCDSDMAATASNNQVAAVLTATRVGSVE